MDIVEFVEKVCAFPLMEYQKEFVRKAYDAVKNNKRLVYIPPLPPRGGSRYSLELLQALVIIVVAEERGLIREKESKNDSYS